MANKKYGKKIVVIRTIREKLNNEKCWAGQAFFDKLEKKVMEIVDEAMNKAKKNGRTTVMERDL